MRKKLRVIAVIVALFACASMLDGCIKSPKAGTSMDLSGMEIVFQDNFDAPILDATKWTTARYNTTNDSPIRRGGYWDCDQVTFDGANLIITTEYLADGKHGAGWYTGMVNSNNIQEFRYGYYEVRCKAPKAEGLWSAFWLQADDIAKVTGDGKNGTEIDILETPFWNDVKSGKKLKNTVFHTLHTDGYKDDHKSKTSGYFKVGKDIYDEFNTYGVHWTADGYVFYVNGEETWRTSWLGNSQVEQFMILSVEISGKDGNPSNPDNQNSWAGEIENNPAECRKSQFIVDYVKVYQDKKV